MENVRYNWLLRTHLHNLHLMAEELKREDSRKSCEQFEAEADFMIDSLEDIKRISRNNITKGTGARFLWSSLLQVIGLSPVSRN